MLDLISRLGEVTRRSIAQDVVELEFNGRPSPESPG
jgi:hypothetical protein